MFEAIATGVIANFVFGYIQSNASDRIRSFAPNLFFGGGTPLLEADKAFDEAKQEIIELHGESEPLKSALLRFLSYEKTVKGGVLSNLLEHLFFNAPLRRKELDDNFYQCFDNPSAAKLRNYQYVIDDLIKSVRGHLLGKQRTAPFVIDASLNEISSVLTSIRRCNERLDQNFEKFSNLFNPNDGVDDFSRAYLRSIKEQIEKIVISGLESFSRAQEQLLNHAIEDAYVPVSVNSIRGGSNSPASSTERFNAIDVIKSLPKLVFRGPAGSGKTTLVQWVIWKSDPFNDDPASTDRLPYFPIHIPLRRLEKSGTFEFITQNVIYNSLADEVLKANLPIDWLDKLVKKDIEIILLFDGVDEINEKNRIKIWQFISDLIKKYPNIRCLITSRHISSVHLADGSYRSDIFLNKESFDRAKKLWGRPEGFFEFVVSPLSNSDIFRLIDQWYAGADVSSVSNLLEKEVKHFPEELKEQLFQDHNSSTLELSRTPLLCSLICLVFFQQRGKLPKNKKQLYDYSTELLIASRDEVRGISQQIDFDREKRRQLLKHIALIMQEGIESWGADQTIEADRDQVLHWIENWLSRFASLNIDASECLDFLTGRCCIIREPGFNRIDFVHRSFMEFLAAEELVNNRETHQVRQKIVLDEWQNTLQFAMSTSSGSAFYASQLLKSILEYVAALEDKNEKRKFYLRSLQLLTFMEEIPPRLDEEIFTACKKLFPIQTDSEVLDLLGVPVRILEKIIRYPDVELLYSEKAIYFTTRLLCLHADPETKKILLSGYQRLQDVTLIEMINHSEKLSVSEHHALYQRLKNRSYTRPVFLTTGELGDQELRSEITNSVWIKFPATSSEFVGWDYLHRCREVRFMKPTQDDLEILSASVKIRGFDNCKQLTITHGHSFDLQHLSRIAKNLEVLIIESSSGFTLTGLKDCLALREIWVVHCSHDVPILSTDIPPQLESIVFDRSINPTIIDQNLPCEILTEERSAEDIYVC